MCLPVHSVDYSSGLGYRSIEGVGSDLGALCAKTCLLHKHQEWWYFAYLPAALQPFGAQRSGQVKSLQVAAEVKI